MSPAAPRKSPAGAPAAAGLRPALWAPVALAVLALGAYGYTLWQRAGQAAAQREQLLRDVEAATAVVPPDSDELARLTQRLQKLPDAGVARDLLLATARVDFARGRVDRAAAVLAPLVEVPGASAAEQRFAAQVWRRKHELGAPDRPAAVALLRQQHAFASAAYGEGNDVGDLFLAWLAVFRLPDAELAPPLAQKLAADHGASPEARFPALVAAASLDMPATELETLRGQFTVPPAEIDAMLALLALQRGDLSAALGFVEPLLTRSPGVVEVRRAAALVLHACALGSPAGSPDRAAWLQRRDLQLDWLFAQAPPDDAGRATWATMREQR
ncbi:MAG: hypothetical protein JNK49_11660 [Planctomycetes bacterium]|nr:hypothetical protein [Planctomycetota bacterium]